MRLTIIYFVYYMWNNEGKSGTDDRNRFPKGFINEPIYGSKGIKKERSYFPEKIEGERLPNEIASISQTNQ